MEWALLPLTKVTEIKLDNRSSRLAIKKRKENEKKKIKSESSTINEVDAMLSPLPLKLPTTRNILRTTFSEAVPHCDRNAFPEIKTKSSKGASASPHWSTPTTGSTLLPSKELMGVTVDNVSKTLEELTLKKTSRYIIS